MKRNPQFIHLLSIVMSLFLSLIPIYRSWGNEGVNKDTDRSAFVIAINKILNFVKANKNDFRVEELILLDYIQRRFGLPVEFRFESTFTRVPTGRDIQSLEIYGKIVNYSGVKFKKPNSTVPFVWNEIDALFIDKIEDCSTPSEILSKLWKQAGEGGYALTHSALALAWYMEQGCLSSSDKEVGQLKEFLISEMLRLARQQPFPTDLKVEALAFICYLGGRDELNVNDVLSLISYQRLDGAFSGSNDPYKGVNVHTTLLCLWLFCEMAMEKYNDQEPMIRRKFFRIEGGD